jgi:NADH-quinone oxidoreductase subunit C
MSTASESLLNDLHRQVGKIAIHNPHYRKSGSYIDISIEADALVDAARVLSEAGYFLEDLAGVDVSEGIWLVYHFDRYDASSRITLRALVPHGKPSAPSLSRIFKGADWHERECCDFYGVRFEGHPNLKPLLLPDDIDRPPLLKETGKVPILGLIPLERWVENRSKPRAGTP